MKKALALLMCMLVIASALFSCGTTDTDPDQTPGTTTSPAGDSAATTETPEDPHADLKRKLAGDWSSYLVRKERMLQDMDWALDYIEAFYSTPNWETLIEARAALSAAIQEISLLNFPAYGVTPEQHAELIAAGYDITGVWAELNRLESIRTELLNSCAELTNQLYDNVFFSPLTACAKEYAAYVRTSVGIEEELSANYTDNLFFELQNDTLKEDFMAYMQKEDLRILQYLPQWSDDLSTIEKTTRTILDKLEASVDLLNVWVGKSLVALDQVNESLNSNDAEHIAQVKLSLPDGANTFLLPLDVEPVKMTFFYTYTEDYDTFEHASPGEPIAHTPNCCQVTFAGMTENDYKKYFLLLSDAGFTPVDLEAADGKHSASYSIGDAFVVISFENGEVSCTTTGDTVHLIPLNYYN